MIRTESIILAAGYSSRAKTNKMLLTLGNKTVLEHCIDTFYAHSSKLFVIGGHRIDEIRPLLMNDQKLQLVYNSHYREGMFSSVKEGLKHITAEQFFITPGDYPMIQQATITLMLHHDEPIIIPMYNGIPGHPVLMKSYLIPEIIMGCYENLRDFIASKAVCYLEVPDMGVITDIDTMEDYERILTIFQ